MVRRFFDGHRGRWSAVNLALRIRIVSALIIALLRSVGNGWHMAMALRQHRHNDNDKLCVFA